MSQKIQILQALQAGEKLTHLDALMKFGCNRLAARINELRDARHKINSEMRKENGKAFSVYWMDQ